MVVELGGAAAGGAALRRSQFCRVRVSEDRAGRLVWHGQYLDVTVDDERVAGAIERISVAWVTDNFKSFFGVPPPPSLSAVACVRRGCAISRPRTHSCSIF
jgi:hypothetical protein